MAWRLALAAAIACAWSNSLKATETQGSATASRAIYSSDSPDQLQVDASTSGLPVHSSPLPVTPTATTSPSRPPPPDLDSLGRMLGYLTLFAALAGAGIYFVKFGLPLARKGASADRKLQVLETRPLGNRQYLLVVGYEETRILLGITPGKIDYLCPLDTPAGSADFVSMMGAVEGKSPRP